VTSYCCDPLLLKQGTNRSGGCLRARCRGGHPRASGSHRDCDSLRPRVSPETGGYARHVSGLNRVFDREQVERARSYHRPLYRAELGAIALNLVLLVLLSFTVIGDHLYALTSGWPWPARAVSFSFIVVTLTAFVRLPIAYWAGYLQEHEWALSNQSRGAWAGERVKGLAVSLVLITGALLGLIASARFWPVAWPALVAAAAASLVLLLGFFAPLILEPLFSKFRPVTDDELATRLQALAATAGFAVERVLVADASRRTRKLNAYVSGLGRTRRLVLFDTLLAEATQPELELVVAHELGHRKARHLVKATLLGMFGAVTFVIALWALLRWPALRSSLDVTGPGDPRLVPFVLLLGSVFGLMASPLGASLSRRWEREADAFSLELTGDLESFESTHRRLALANLADLAPPRIVYLAWFSHPTPPERIAAARMQSLEPAKSVAKPADQTATAVDQISKSKRRTSVSP
jgi:STE24 endopeptidase